MDRKILIVVGLPGSGKSVVADILKKNGIPMFRTGDVIRSEVLRRGLSLTPKNSEMIARKFREEEGMDVAARRVGEKIKKLKDRVICVEGPRDIYEINYFKTLGKVVILVVESPEKIRFERSMSRKGDGLEPKTRDPKTLEEFKWRDEKELERGMKDVLTTDKYQRIIIQNTGTLEDLKEKVNKFLNEIKD